MRNTNGKDSWKERQEGILRVTELMEKKKRVVNNKSIADLVAVLKERLSEVNLNLRAKVLICIEQVIRALGPDGIEYASVLFPDMLRLCNEAKQNIISALYSALTAWVEVDAMQKESRLNALGQYLSMGLKAPKGRLSLLTWLHEYASLIDQKTAVLVASDLLDCLTDKAAPVRNKAMSILETITPICPRSILESNLKGRPSPDVASLRQFFDQIYANTPSSRPSNSSASTARESEPNRTEMGNRIQSLANRPNARVLVKPKAGEGFKSRFSNVKSSIPKPMPRASSLSHSRLSEDSLRLSYLSATRGAHPMHYLVLETSIRSELSSVTGDLSEAFFLSYPVPLNPLNYI